MAARCWCLACSCSGENVIFMTRFKYFHIVIVQAPGSGVPASTSYGIGHLDNLVLNRERDRVMVGGVVTLGWTSIYSEYIWEHFDSQMYLADLYLYLFGESIYVCTIIEYWYHYMPEQRDCSRVEDPWAGWQSVSKCSVVCTSLHNQSCQGAAAKIDSKGNPNF